MSDSDLTEDTWSFDFGLREVVLTDWQRPFSTRSGRLLTLTKQTTSWERTKPDVEIPAFPRVHIIATEGKRCVGYATLDQFEHGSLVPHGKIETAFRRDGLARAFFDLAAEHARDTGCHLVKPKTMSEDGQKAWRGRNYFRGTHTNDDTSSVIEGPDAYGDPLMARSLR